MVTRRPDIANTSAPAVVYRRAEGYCVTFFAAVSPTYEEAIERPRCSFSTKIVRHWSPVRYVTNLQIAKAKEKRAREVDLEGLDMSNVIEGSRRRGRTEVFNPQQPKRRRTGPSAPSDSEDPEDIGSDDGDDSQRSDGTGSDSDSASEFEFELSGS